MENNTVHTIMLYKSGLAVKEKGGKVDKKFIFILIYPYIYRENFNLRTF